MLCDKNDETSNQSLFYIRVRWLLRGDSLQRLSAELYDDLKVWIRSINKGKDHSLKSRLFVMLCDKNNETLNQLLFYIRVRWLLRGDSLQRLSAELYDGLKNVDQVNQ